jgi:hypothetical protein
MKAGTVGVVMAMLAMAVSTVPAAEPEGWRCELTPYLWFMGIDGDLTIRGQKADFDKSASDVFDGVDAAGSLLGVAQYDRYLFWGQVDYMSYSTENLDVQDRPQGGKFSTDTILGEAAVGYQVDGWAEGQTFDLLIGARTLHMENDLEVYGKGTRSKDRDITDPIIVMRPSLPVLPSKIQGLRFNPTLGIGGGGDSDLVYELQPQFQYQITEKIAARLGYRTVGYRFKGDNAQNENLNLTKDDELNINFSGMIVGLGVTF